ncbi:hypothetical protein M758_2G183900 [Ceratodon purpureus]|nr:hypothetical protein M758_2G183900 [Ceratodon purpureus]
MYLNPTSQQHHTNMNRVLPGKLVDSLWRRDGDGEGEGDGDGELVAVYGNGMGELLLVGLEHELRMRVPGRLRKRWSDVVRCAGGTRAVGTGGGRI